MTPPSQPATDTIAAAVYRSAERLGCRLEADLLVGHLLGRDRAWLYAHAEDPLDRDQISRLEQLLKQRLAGRPVAQIVGRREFYGRCFVVTDRVLIPRPETELLIDLALGLALPDEASVVDVGTGSGCIALTLAAERPAWSVRAVDRCAEALKVAEENRQRQGLERVELLEGDLLEPTGTARFDLIVSNPPYVAENDPHLAAGDVRFEPHQALVGGSDGLVLIRRLVEQAAAQLYPGGWLLIEHGHDQADRVRALFEAAGFSSVRTHRDLAGIERATLGARAEATPQRHL